MRAGALALSMYLPASVLAGTSGVGATGDTARSLASNPALAIGGGGTDLAAEYQTTMVFLGYKRAGVDADGDPYKEEKSFVHGEVPYFAVRSDAFGKSAQRARGESSSIGLGFSVSLPFSSGAKYESSSAGRYHVIDATTYSVYLAPAFAIRPIPAARVGVAPVLAMSRLSVIRRIDLAPSLGEILGCDQSVPGDCPDAETGLLEGEFKVKDATGFAPTYMIGGAWDVGERGTFGLSYTGGTPITLQGRSTLTPSLDFNVRSHADFSMTQYLPPIANGGGRWRFTPELTGTFEAQWIGYSASKLARTKIENSEIDSSNADLQSLLDFLDINEGQLVEGILDKEQTTRRGWQNSWNAVAGAQYDLDKVRVRLEGGFFAHSTPDQYVSTANQDYDNFVIGGSAVYKPKPRFSIALNLHQYFNSGRHVTNSYYDPKKGSESGYAYPSGNGDYSALATRASVTTLLHF